MASVVSQVLSIYKQEGAVTLIKKSFRKVRSDIHSKLMSIRGHYSITLDNNIITFSAPTPKVVKRNRGRFKSERQELRDLINEVKEDDIVYDVGANTGLYTLFAAKACPDGEVVAFEPYPPNLGLLKQDIARNQLQNVTVIDVVLSDSAGSVKFSQPGEDDIGYGSSSIEANESVNTIDVQSTTGDQLITDGKIPAPNIIKIDVEGSEPLVLEGLKKTLSDPACRAVYCEVHLPAGDHRPSVEDFGSSPEKIENQLTEFGFKVKQLHQRKNEVFYKATK